MKQKVLISLLYIYLFSHCIIAQEKNLFTLGVSTGQNISSMRGTAFIDKNHESKKGLSFGLFAEYSLNDYLSIRPELFYTRKGSESPYYTMECIGGFILGSVGGEFHYDYLDLALLFNASIGSNLIIFVNAGPYLGYLLNQTDDMKTIGEYPLIYPAKSFDFGLTAGIGLAIPLNPNVAIQFEARNSLGLMDIGDVPLNYDHGAIYHNSIGLLGSLKYSFN